MSPKALKLRIISRPMWAMLAIATQLASGCGGGEAHQFPQREYQMPVTVDQAPVSRTDGSLWTSNASANFLYTDQRAFRVGDLLTVRVVEEANAQRAAGTSTSQETEFNAQLEEFAGLVEQLEDLDSDIDPSALIDISSSRSFSGQGETARSEMLEATVQVMVHQVLPNGNLFVEGHRVITVNAEEQYLYVSGVARPNDIDDANEIASSLLAEAQIEFTGSGIISDQQSPGWFSEVLNAIWPF